MAKLVSLSEDIYNMYVKCQKMFITNRKLLALIGEHHNDDGKIYSSRTIDCVEEFFIRKFNNPQYFLNESATISQLNSALQVGLAVQGNIQLENPTNLEQARNNVVDFYGDKVPCYYEDDDYIYYWEPTKHQINIDKHSIDLEDAVYYFNHQYNTYHYIATIVDEKHPNVHNQYKCVDGKMRFETNYVRYILSLDDNNKPNIIKIVYNVRYSEQDDKYIIKFISVYEAKLPSNLTSKCAKVYKISINEQTYTITWQEAIHMKFKNRSTGEIVDLSDKVDTLTIKDLSRYTGIDDEAVRLKTRLLSEWNRSTYDYDKIFSYNEIVDGGAWYGYYDERPLTDCEWNRREKYYESNRIVFNEQLDKMRANNPNFVKMFRTEFIRAKNAITYGAPQSTVKTYMAKLYGEQVLDLLVEEDPQDDVIDPNLRNWKL